MSKLIERVEKLTGQDRYSEPPNRLLNIVIGLGIMSVAILLLNVLTSISNQDTVVTLGFVIVVAIAFGIEEVDFRKGGRRNWCHLAMRTVGAFIGAVLYQVIF